MNTKDIEEMRKQKFYQYLQVAGFHKEAEEWFTQHHEAEVERAVEAEREKFERAIGMTIMKFGHGREELKYLIEALTKTDNQTEV